jgi:SagB-type dehydrogenase family enzyme
VPQNDIRFCTHAAVRLLRLREADSDAWLAVHLSEKRRFLAAEPVAALLVALMGPGRTINDTLDVSSHLGLDSSTSHQLFKFLVGNHLVVDEQDKSHLACLNRWSTWARFGWQEAYDYHLATYDYPFLDYSQDGNSIDEQRMRRYRHLEPEPERTKRFPNRLQSLQAPSCPAALAELRVPIAEALVPNSTSIQKPLTSEALLTLLSIAFGRLRETAIPDEPAIAPLIRKTSPSGGSRHPTEGYVVVHDVPELESGIYHYAVGASTLDQICGAMPLATLRDCAPGLFWAPFDPSALLILTTVFSRNMYRYREPRTFRTVFMDIGHVLGTIEVAARALGIRTYLQHGIRDDCVEKFIQTELLEEAVVYGVALA